MGFGDRLKDLRDQAQHAVAENKDKIQGAVQSVGEAANARTHGKYADKIARAGEKVSGEVEKLAGAQEQAGGAAPAGPTAATGTPPADTESADTPAAERPGAGSPPEFE